MKISYTACDKCTQQISSGYVLQGPLVRLADGITETVVLEPGDYCTACFVGACMAHKLGMEETGKYGTREKPLL